ncbi:hypothetical protein Tco_0514177 [Tanacetum coccineum]
MPGAPATDDTELEQHMTEFATRVRQDTDEIYRRLDYAHDDRMDNVIDDFCGRSTCCLEFDVLKIALVYSWRDEDYCIGTAVRRLQTCEEPASGPSQRQDTEDSCGSSYVDLVKYVAILY